MTRYTQVPTKVDADGCFYNSDLVKTSFVVGKTVTKKGLVSEMYVTVKVPVAMRGNTLQNIAECLFPAFYTNGRTYDHIPYKVGRKSRSEVILKVYVNRYG